MATTLSRPLKNAKGLFLKHPHCAFQQLAKAFKPDDRNRHRALTGLPTRRISQP